MGSQKFTQLGIQVIDGEVRTYNGFGKGRPLGMLAGAHAEVSEAGTVKAGAAIAHSLLSGPAGLIMGRRDSFAFISFADGTLHEVKIQGKSNWKTAQQEAMRFNLLAQRALPSRDLCRAQVLRPHCRASPPEIDGMYTLSALDRFRSDVEAAARRVGLL